MAAPLSVLGEPLVGVELLAAADVRSVRALTGNPDDTRVIARFCWHRSVADARNGASSAPAVEDTAAWTIIPGASRPAYRCVEADVGRWLRVTVMPLLPPAGTRGRTGGAPGVSADTALCGQTASRPLLRAVAGPVSPHPVPRAGPSSLEQSQALDRPLPSRVVVVEGQYTAVAEGSNRLRVHLSPRQLIADSGAREPLPQPLPQQPAVPHRDTSPVRDPSPSRSTYTSDGWRTEDAATAAPRNRCSPDMADTRYDPWPTRSGSPPATRRSPAAQQHEQFRQEQPQPRRGPIRIPSHPRGGLQPQLQPWPQPQPPPGPQISAHNLHDVPDTSPFARSQPFREAAPPPRQQASSLLGMDAAGHLPGGASSDRHNAAGQHRPVGFPRDSLPPGAYPPGRDWQDHRAQVDNQRIPPHETGAAHPYQQFAAAPLQPWAPGAVAALAAQVALDVPDDLEEFIQYADAAGSEQDPWLDLDGGQYHQSFHDALQHQQQQQRLPPAPPADYSTGGGGSGAGRVQPAQFHSHRFPGESDPGVPFVPPAMQYHAPGPQPSPPLPPGATRSRPLTQQPQQQLHPPPTYPYGESYDGPALSPMPPQRLDRAFQALKLGDPQGDAGSAAAGEEGLRGRLADWQGWSGALGGPTRSGPPGHGSSSGGGSASTFSSATGSLREALEALLAQHQEVIQQVASDYPADTQGPVYAPSLTRPVMSAPARDSREQHASMGATTTSSRMAPAAGRQQLLHHQQGSMPHPSNRTDPTYLTDVWPGFNPPVPAHTGAVGPGSSRLVQGSSFAAGGQLEDLDRSLPRGPPRPGVQRGPDGPGGFSRTTLGGECMAQLLRHEELEADAEAVVGAAAGLAVDQVQGGRAAGADRERLSPGTAVAGSPAARGVASSPLPSQRSTASKASATPTAAVESALRSATAGGHADSDNSNSNSARKYGGGSPVVPAAAAAPAAPAVPPASSSTTTTTATSSSSSLRGMRTMNEALMRQLADSTALQMQMQRALDAALEQLLSHQAKEPSAPQHRWADSQTSPIQPPPPPASPPPPPPRAQPLPVSVTHRGTSPSAPTTGVATQVAPPRAGSPSPPPRLRESSPRRQQVDTAVIEAAASGGLGVGAAYLPVFTAAAAATSAGGGCADNASRKSRAASPVKGSPAMVQAATANAALGATPAAGMESATGACSSEAMSGGKGNHVAASAAHAGAGGGGKHVAAGAASGLEGAAGPPGGGEATLPSAAAAAEATAMRDLLHQHHMRWRLKKAKLKEQAQAWQYTAWRYATAWKKARAMLQAMMAAQGAPTATAAAATADTLAKGPVPQPPEAVQPPRSFRPLAPERHAAPPAGPAPPPAPAPQPIGTQPAGEPTELRRLSEPGVMAGIAAALQRREPGSRQQSPGRGFPLPPDAGAYPLPVKAPAAAQPARAVGQPDSGTDRGPTLRDVRGSPRGSRASKPQRRRPTERSTGTEAADGSAPLVPRPTAKTMPVSGLPIPGAAKQLAAAGEVSSSVAGNNDTGRDLSRLRDQGRARSHSRSAGRGREGQDAAAPEPIETAAHWPATLRSGADTARSRSPSPTMPKPPWRIAGNSTCSPPRVRQNWCYQDSTAAGAPEIPDNGWQQSYPPEPPQPFQQIKPPAIPYRDPEGWWHYPEGWLDIYQRPSHMLVQQGGGGARPQQRHHHRYPEGQGDAAGNEM